MVQEAPEYAVITLEPTVTKLNNAYPATIQGIQDVQVRPYVSGFLTRLLVDEGAQVKKGQALFEIDPVFYKQTYEAAKAQVAVAEASVETARLVAENQRELADRNIVSQFDKQKAENDLATAKAQLESAKANLISARQNLDYTKVTSPSDGVVGTFPFRVGSLVSSQNELTTVSDISRMYVYFSLNEKQLIDLTRQGATQEAIASMPAVELKLADGTLFSQKGRIDAISGVIDPATGSASVRAVFENPDRILRSGASGVVLLPVQSDSSLVIPQSATSEIQDKRFAFVVTDSSTVKMVEIATLSIDDGQTFVVTSGLKPGDRVVVEGVGTSVRDGMKIKPITPAESAAKLRGATAGQTEK